MKTLILMCTVVCASLLTSRVTANEGSPYDALVEVQALDSIYSYTLEDTCPDRLAHRDPVTRPVSQQQPRFFGWVDEEVEPKTKIQVTGQATAAPPEDRPAQGLQVKKYDGPPLGPNELPYIDSQGYAGNKYGIMLTAEWCGWCQKMYGDTVDPLRKDGYKVFVIDMDQFPDIKDRIYRRDPTAEKMGRGAPYFIVREGGKTKKVFYGYTRPGLIKDFLKKPDKLEKPEDEPDDNDLYDLR